MLNGVERVRRGVELIFLLREHRYVVTFDLKMNLSVRLFFNSS